MSLDLLQALRMALNRRSYYCLQRTEQEGEANLSPFHENINFVIRENKQLKKVRAMTNIPPMAIHKMWSVQALKRQSMI